MNDYNGYPCYAYENVSLWLSNDEGTYRLMRRALSITRTKDRATEYLMARLPDRTPDGARYSKSAIRYALRGE